MEKTPGSSLREAICARVTVCDRGEKINHFQKPHCFKIWSNATVLSAKYSIWQRQVVEKHKSNLPDWPGQRVYSSIIFCESSFLWGWLRQLFARISGRAGLKQAKTQLGMGSHAIHRSLVSLQLRFPPPWQVNPILKVWLSNKDREPCSVFWGSPDGRGVGEDGCVCAWVSFHCPSETVTNIVNWLYPNMKYKV